MDPSVLQARQITRAPQSHQAEQKMGEHRVVLEVLWFMELIGLNSQPVSEAQVPAGLPTSHRLWGYWCSPLHPKRLHSEIFAFTYYVCDPRGGCFELVISGEVADDNPSGHSWREPEGDFLMGARPGEGIWDGCHPQTHQRCEWLLSRGSKTLIQSPL